jgi:hypothetical protein
MAKTDVSALASMPAGLQSTGTTAPAKSPVANKTQKNMAAFQPVINYDPNQTMANETAGNASAAANASQSAANKPAMAPSPAIPGGQPFFHQQDKPFSTALTSPSGPFKATRESTANATGFDRFLRNTVGAGARRTRPSTARPRRRHTSCRQKPWQYRSPMTSSRARGA